MKQKIEKSVESLFSPKKGFQMCLTIACVIIFFGEILVLIFQLQSLIPLYQFYQSLSPSKCDIHSYKTIDYYCEIHECSLILFNVTQQIHFNSNQTKVQKEIKIPTEKSNLINILKRYEIGKIVECYYDPSVKSKVMFERPSLWFHILLTGVIVMCILFCFCSPIPILFCCAKLGNPKFLESYEKYNLKLNEYIL
eukprot:gene5125-8723_t